MQKRLLFTFSCTLFLLSIQINALAEDINVSQNPELVQAQVILTVSESKRLIAKAVAQMPKVQNALKEGLVIIAKGTTNTYVAEEILGRKIEHGTFVSGRVFPAKGSKEFKSDITPSSEFILKNGRIAKGISYADAVKELKPADVVIKGANALDYRNRTAGVMIGASDGGTTGKFMPYLVGRKAHLVIPVGLEKLVAGDVLKIANKMREPVESLNRIPSMFLLTGDIVTEIEALRILANVSVFQAGSGGIGGAEGAVRLVIRSTKEEVKKALQIIEDIQGEPPFVE